MTDLLDGRALDLALAEVTGEAVEWLPASYDPETGVPSPITFTFQTADEGNEWFWKVRREPSYSACIGGVHVSGEPLPCWNDSLDLIAAAEEPLVKAGWEQKIVRARNGCEVEWWRYDHADLPAVYVFAPTEKIARGNAAYRALLRLKEETNG